MPEAKGTTSEQSMEEIDLLEAQLKETRARKNHEWVGPAYSLYWLAFGILITTVASIVSQEAGYLLFGLFLFVIVNVLAVITFVTYRKRISKIKKLRQTEVNRIEAELSVKKTALNLNRSMNDS